MKLKKLLQSIKVDVRGGRDVEITGVTSDSRTVAPGNLFIARKGFEADGSTYIPEALLAGAAAIATDLYDPSLKVPQLIAPDLRHLEADLADAFYGHPSSELFIAGVTGTNGKTSTTFLIKHLFDGLGIPCGLIGSIEYIVGEWHQPATHTSPEPATVQKLLREMVSQGCKAAVLEASSHGLDQKRCRNIEFDVGIFTNLTHDHLDYHGTMENYLAAKRSLFDQSKKAVLNSDDGSITIDGALTYGIDSGLLRATDIKLKHDRSHFTLTYQNHSIPCTLPLVGHFNILNALAALGTVITYGADLEKACQLLATAPPIRGRLEPVPNPKNLQILVDFSHTPDALTQVLNALQQTKQGRVITVFGCGGNRDQTKRPEMGKVATSLSDYAIVTSDNPRQEDPETICQQIIANLPSTHPYEVIVDRKQAIAHAIEMATPQDTILIAGKGHETYQIVGTRRLPFDDLAIARSLCDAY